MGEQDVKGPLLMEPATLADESPELQVGESLIQPTKDGFSQVVIINPTGFTQSLSPGTELGGASEASVIDSTPVSMQTHAGPGGD